MPAKKTSEEAPKPRSRQKAAEPVAPEAQPLLKDRRFVGALVVLAAVVVFAGGYFVGHAAGSDAERSAGDRQVVVDRDGVPSRPGYLGVVGTDARRLSGALILEVVPGSPADEAGLERGDLVVAVSTRDITSMRELARVIRATTPGTTVELGVVRGDRRIGVTAVVGSEPGEPVARPGRLPIRPRR